jgi:hypothetical protein
MNNRPYIQAALARERQNMLLAEAEAARLARQLRSHRRSGRLPATRTSRLRRIPAVLGPGWRWLLAAVSGYGPSCMRAPLRRGAAAVRRQVQPADPAAECAELVRR